ncbi:MAG: hypothetical protein ACFFED_16045 [Candidatus Thorarchaeota archaeon]
MSSGQSVTTQLQLGDTTHQEDLTVFCPPGITVETAKYPILMSGILASTQPAEFLSIYDHPTAWRGLDREAIISMRRQLYRFLVPTDARSLVPKDVVESLQQIALSVSPVAIGVEAPTLPPRRLHSFPGQLPMGSDILVKSFDIRSEPEISRVAQKISQKDIPASEAICQLFDYDYALEQIARLLAVGLLGMHKHRKLVPIKNAFKISIDSYIDNALLDLSEKPSSSTIRIHQSSLFGDSFIVVSAPGEPRVDYFQMEISQDRVQRHHSIESVHYGSSNAKASLYASHARFSSYQEMMRQNESSHVFVFHLNRDNRNSTFGPWIARAGVQEAYCGEGVEIDSIANFEIILDALLYPKLPIWAEGTPLLKRLGFEPSSTLEHYL